MNNSTNIDLKRRKFLGITGNLTVTLGLGSMLGVRTLYAKPDNIIARIIPASGEKLPAIGMGTWLTFNVGDNQQAREQRVQVLQAFFDRGGALIDSSPMYDSAEAVLGYCLPRIKNRQALFSATKVWINGEWLGIQQMERSRRLWGGQRFDLMQIHNLLDWETHLSTLRDWKAEGKLRYIGVTTSHGRRHDDLSSIMQTQPIDFVQFTYNILDREAEQRLLPQAADKGLAVIINRPFQGGSLFRYVRGKPLPDWAGEFDCHNWAQFFLKFVVSHPAVICAIPATEQAAHMLENMGALYGRLPDAAMRERMVRYIESL